MSDDSNVCVAIFGTLDGNDKLIQLAEAIDASGLSDDWEGGWSDTDEVIRWLLEEVEAGRPIVVMSNHGGNGSELAVDCMQLGLSAVHADEGGYEWSAFVTLREPGKPEREWQGDNDKHVPYLPADKIERMLADGTLAAELETMKRVGAAWTDSRLILTGIDLGALFDDEET